ncbi:MAG TPA: hypothetical protein VLI92_01440 [Candidatus Saccharimonadales bacterium]|nr:hypothetical protein [Candidatus Saccharimonadales bacterium]
MPKADPRAIPEVLKGSKEERLKELEERKANRPDPIDNASLYAGSPMYYYCTSCGHLSDKLPEDWHLELPAKLCPECKSLKDLGWLL